MLKNLDFFKIFYAQSLTTFLVWLLHLEMSNTKLMLVHLLYSTVFHVLRISPKGARAANMLRAPATGLYLRLS